MQTVPIEQADDNQLKVAAFDFQDQIDYATAMIKEIKAELIKRNIERAKAQARAEQELQLIKETEELNEKESTPNT